MGDYVWVTFRTRHSSGYGQWQWAEYPSDMSIAEIQSHLNDVHDTDSEHWRGVDVQIETPPIEVLQREIRHAEGRIKDDEQAITRWTAQILMCTE